MEGCGRRCVDDQRGRRGLRGGLAVRPVSQNGPRNRRVITELIAATKPIATIEDSDDQDLTGLRDICSRSTGPLTCRDIWPKGAGRRCGAGSMKMVSAEACWTLAAPMRAGRTIDH